MKKKWIFTAALSVSFILTGCTKSTLNKRDPYEKFNRSIFAFNTAFDHGVFRPAARVYMMGLPSPVRQGIGNAFTNASEVAGLPNDVFQGKMHFFLHDLMRIVINTTLGIGGLIDVATTLGFEHHHQGYAATLAYYSPKGYQSPYLVLPFLGPFTFQTAGGMLPGFYAEPVAWIGSDAWRYTLVAGYLVSKRTDFMDANAIIDDAFDPYVLVRNAFFQRNDRRIATTLYERRPGDKLPEKEGGDSEATALNNAIHLRA
jgi:phospholipid-binding lipoprotein MlaA